MSRQSRSAAALASASAHSLLIDFDRGHVNLRTSAQAGKAPPPRRLRRHRAPDPRVVRAPPPATRRHRSRRGGRLSAAATPMRPPRKSSSVVGARRRACAQALSSSARTWPIPAPVSSARARANSSLATSTRRGKRPDRAFEHAHIGVGHHEADAVLLQQRADIGNQHRDRSTATVPSWRGKPLRPPSALTLKLEHRHYSLLSQSPS